MNRDGSHDTYNGTWDVPVSDVTAKLGPVDKLTVIVEDGYGRTAQAPFSPNLAITYNWAANYTVPYTAGQPASFTQALVLTKTSGTAPDPADKFLNDTLQWSYSVDGGPWQPLTVLPDTAKVFDASGKLKDRIIIRTDTLNTIPGRIWGGGQHKIQVKVSASPGDAGKYLFTSEDSGGPGPSAVVTVTFAEAHRFGQTPTQAGGGKLWLKWGRDLPNQVNECGQFTAPVEISNNGDVPITTALTFTVDGTIVIVRHFESSDPNSPPPPPQYLNFPLHGTVTKTFTMPAHGVVWWNVHDGLQYTIEGYDGPPSGKGYSDSIMCGFISFPDSEPYNQMPGPLDVGHSAVIGTKDKGWTPVFQPNYAVYIKVTAADPEHYLNPTIDDWVGVKGLSIPSKVGVHLVQ